MDIIELGRLAQLITNKSEDEIQEVLDTEIEAYNLDENQAELLRRAVARLLNQHTS